MNRNSVATWVVILGMVMCGCLGALGFLQGALNEPTLQQQGQVVQAAAVKTRIRCQAIVFCSNQVDYEFTSGNETFKATASVSLPAWNAARAMGRLNVLYLPNKPWVNRAADEDSPAVIVGNVFAAVVCAVLALGGLGWMVSAGLEWAKAPEAPPSEAVSAPMAGPAKSRPRFGLTQTEVNILTLLLLAIACALTGFVVLLFWPK